jgi:DUF1680 family protein
LGKYIYSSGKEEIHIHQYISSEFTTELAQVEMRSNFPWDGKVDIKVNPIIPATEFTIHLRLPSWSVNPQVKVNGEEVETNSILPDYDITVSASSYDPRWSRSLRITRIWNSNDEISLVLNMPIIIRSVLPDVKGHAGKVAITRGPLVYCLENIDHPDLDIFTTKLGTSPFTETFDPDLLGGTVKIIANMPDSKKLTFIPYHLWGNRGESTMTVWINE